MFAETTSWGNYFYGGLRNFIDAEAAYVDTRQQSAKANLSKKALRVADSVSFAVKGITAATILGYGAPLPIIALATLSLLPSNTFSYLATKINRLSNKFNKWFSDDKQTDDSGLYGVSYKNCFSDETTIKQTALRLDRGLPSINTLETVQYLVTNGLTLYQNLLPINWLKIMAVEAVEQPLRWNYGGTLPKYYTDNFIGDWIWVLSGVTGEMVQSHRLLRSAYSEQQALSYVVISPASSVNYLPTVIWTKSRDLINKKANQVGCLSAINPQYVVSILPFVMSQLLGNGLLKEKFNMVNTNFIVLASLSMLQTTNADNTVNLQSGFVAYYPFNGNAQDASGNGHDGTVGGAVLSVDRFGYDNKAYNFDGASSYIKISATSDLTPSYLSVAVWARRLCNTQGASWQRIVSTQSDSRYIIAWFNNTIRGCISTLASTQLCLDSNPVVDNNWHHIILNYEDGSQSLYVDGQLSKQQVVFGPIAGYTAQWIGIGADGWYGWVINGGWGYYTNSYFCGIVDEVRIYNRALTSVEIKAVYNISCSIKLFPPLNNSLVAYYPFNGNAQDASGNGHDGTVGGAVLSVDRFGYDNKAYNFDGASSYIKISATSDLTPSYLSVAVWARRLCNTQGASWQRIVSTQSDSRYIIAWFNNTIRGCISTLASTQLCLDSNPVVDNNWHHIILNYEDGSQSLYVDGQLSKQQVVFGPIAGYTAQWIGIGADGWYGWVINGGWGYYTNSYFCGIVDEVRIYNRALTFSEMLALYNATDPTFTSTRTQTYTATPTPSKSSTATQTSNVTPTPTTSGSTLTSSITDTQTSTRIQTYTATPTPSKSPTATQTSNVTPTPTTSGSTLTSSITDTQTSSALPLTSKSSTASITSTKTITNTPTYVPTLVVDKQNEPHNSPYNDNRLGMGLGIGLGVGVLGIAAATAGIFYCYKKHHKYEAKPEQLPSINSMPRLSIPSVHPMPRPPSLLVQSI